MKAVLGILAGSMLLWPAAASAQYYDGWQGHDRSHDHVDVYRHGDHDDVVVRHHHRRYYEDGPYDDGRYFHHHHDDD